MECSIRDCWRKHSTSLSRSHESLRTVIRQQERGPVQIVCDEFRLRITTNDLTGAAGKTPDEELHRLITAEMGKAHDLAVAPPIRAMLLRIAPHDHIFILSLHHIICDGWSMGVFYRELENAYRALRHGHPPQLPPLPIEIGDYSVWQRGQFEKSSADLAFWREYLADAPPALELPTKGPRPSVFTHAGAKQTHSLGRVTLESLRRLSEREETSLFVILTAGFKAILFRYTSQEDIVMGIPIANRDRPELLSLIGFLIDFQALRTDLSGDPTFRELVKRVQRGIFNVNAHRAVPFEKVIETVGPERNLSHAPLFQVMLIWKDRHVQMQFTELDGLTVTHVPAHPGSSKFDLTFWLTDVGDDLWVEVEYCTDLFTAETIARMVGHFQTLLAAAAADPERKISELPLLTVAERQQLLVEWNDTAIEYPHEKCVHELFEEQVERTPGAVAVVFQGQELSYRELNERANQVAHRLCTLGVGPETLVGLYLDRSLELVIGILGILKAGGAYLPLDPNHPPGRLEFILRDSTVAHLVTQRQLMHRLPVTIDAPVLLGPDEPTCVDLATGNPQTDVGPRHLAYTMYTSGSTGQPKGVQIPHSAVVNLLTAMAVQPGLTQDDRLLSVTTPTFDISVLELLLPLTVGACVEVLPQEVVSDAIGLAARSAKSAATVMQATPATWQMLIHAGWDGCRNLKVLCGGEALPDSLATELRRRSGELWNMYGPTETTIWSTTRQMTHDRISGSLGRPIANTRVYVLDRHFQLVPIGVPGELCIGGAGLARGYLNRPELTAEKFIDNPFDDAPQARMYRTGDLCRSRADGNLEFLGRIDNQVKLRGFRIELGEIEAVLNQHPAVAQCVVVMREDCPGDKRLVAYCVAAGTAALDVAALNGHLRTRLPDYMVPAAFVPLDALPLTPSGKIDSHAFPAPDVSRPELQTSYVAPRNLIEQQLTSLWCELLGLDHIGVDDSFFELGGHSLMAVRLFARIEQAFGRKLPVAMIFQHGTIAHLANCLAESVPVPEIVTAMQLQAGRNGGRPLFLMPSIAGELLISKLLIEELGKCYPVIGMQPSFDARNINGFRDIRTTARHFVSAFAPYQPHGPYALAGFSYGGYLAFEVACILNELGESVDLLALIDTGPNRRGLKPQFGERWRRLARILGNVPFWLCEEFRHFSAKRLAGSAARKLRRFYRILASHRRARIEVDDIFELSGRSSQNYERMQTVFAACRDYVPRPYAGKLTLFRAKTRPLLGGCFDDLGWGRYVGAVDVRSINGDHETILHPPHVGELTRQLAELLSMLPKSDVVPAPDAADALVGVTHDGLAASNPRPNRAHVLVECGPPGKTCQTN